MNFTERDRGAARGRDRSRRETTIKELEAEARELELKIWANEQKVQILNASRDWFNLEFLTKDIPATGGDPLHKDPIKTLLADLRQIEEEVQMEDEVAKEIKRLEAAIKKDLARLEEIKGELTKLQGKEKQEPGKGDSAQPGALSRGSGGSNPSLSV